MKQSKFYPAIVLGSICLTVALLLSAINMITAPIIAERENASANAALVEVLPDGKDFKEIEITGEYPASVKAGWAAVGGYVFKMSVTGKSAGLVIMVGISADQKVVGTKVVSNEETPSYAEKVFSNLEGTEGEYAGDTLDGFESVIISGATLTSRAYGEAVKAALQSAVLAAGGEVDTRTPEQILQDNCNAALGTEGKTFERWFATEEIEGVDTVYETTDDSGRVYKIGESFIGVAADGTVATADTDAETATIVTAADATVEASTITEITNPDGFGVEITKAYATASGNYVFELSAKGYDVSFEYSNGHMPGNTPQPIIIKLSISAEGKIIDCVTVKHSESKGYGDKCATDEYRDSWSGIANDDLIVLPGVPSHNSTHTQGQSGPGVISGATYTTQGYQKAVKAAFAAFELLVASEGGN